MYISYKKSALQRILSDNKETKDKSIKRGILRSSHVTTKVKRCLNYLNLNKKIKMQNRID